MIVVDTSIWVEAIRGNPKLGPALESLLDSGEAGLPIVVRLELLSGAPTERLPSLRHALWGVPLLEPSTATWRRVEGWTLKARQEGERFGLGDLLIAAMAEERQATVWSLDGDFARMARLGFVRLHA